MTYPDNTDLEQARNAHRVAERIRNDAAEALAEAEAELIEAAADLNTAHARYQEAATTWHARMGQKRAMEMAHV